MKKLVLLLIANLILALDATSARSECPGAEALRQQLVAQNTANIQRVLTTRNCALIPGVLAYLRRANATIERAFIAADCHSDGAKLSTAELEAQLRSRCDPSLSKSATQTAATSPSIEGNSKQKKRVTKEARTAPSPATSKQVLGAQNPSSDCSTITGLGNDTGPSNCAPTNRVPPNIQARTNQPLPPAKTYVPESPPSKGEVLEALREQLPELGKVLDATANTINSPNIPPPDQWTNVSNPPPVTLPSSRKTNPSEFSDTAPRQDDQNATTKIADDSTNQKSAALEDHPEEDYAADCQSESAKNGLKSLKQDIEDALKEGPFGIQHFKKKLKLQWATLKKCVRDPLQKAFIDKLDRVLDSDSGNQNSITPQ